MDPKAETFAINDFPPALILNERMSELLTLRAYGTTMPIANPKLLQQREADGKPPQPVQILVSQSGNIDSCLRFFQQPVPRWLLTTAAGAKHWHSDRDLPGFTNSTGSEFEKIMIAKMGNQGIDWVDVFSQLGQLELKPLAILGGRNVKVFIGSKLSYL